MEPVWKAVILVHIPFAWQNMAVSDGRQHRSSYDKLTWKLSYEVNQVHFEVGLVGCLTQQAFRVHNWSHLAAKFRWLKDAATLLALARQQLLRLSCVSTRAISDYRKRKTTLVGCSGYIFLWILLAVSPYHMSSKQSKNFRGTSEEQKLRRGSNFK